MSGKRCYCGQTDKKEFEQHRNVCRKCHSEEQTAKRKEKRKRNGSQLNELDFNIFDEFEESSSNVEYHNMYERIVSIEQKIDILDKKLNGVLEQIIKITQYLDEDK